MSLGAGVDDCPVEPSICLVLVRRWWSLSEVLQVRTLQAGYGTAPALGHWGKGERWDDGF